MADFALMAFLLSNALCVAGFAGHRAISKGTTQGLKATTQTLGLCSMLSWSAYGILSGLPLQAIANSFTIMSTVLILIIGLRAREFASRDVVTVASGYLLLVVPLTVLLGSSALALAASVLLVIDRWPETVEAWVNPGGRGISVSSFGLLVVQSGAWAGFGYIHGDAWIVVSSLYLGMQASYMVARTLHGRRAAGYRVPSVSLQATCEKLVDCPVVAEVH